MIPGVKSRTASKASRSATSRSKAREPFESSPFRHALLNRPIKTVNRDAHQHDVAKIKAIPTKGTGAGHVLCL